MKNQTLSFSTRRNSRLDFSCVVLILLALVLGCSDSGDSSSSGETVKKSVSPTYVGVWTGQDGSTVTFRNDGTGDYKSGGKSVSGATVEIDEAAKEIRFSLLGFDSGKYKIDQTPAGNKMKLDGMEYRRAGGFDAGNSETTADVSTSEIPSENELRPLVGETLQNFNGAVQQSDFTDFYSAISETWQSQTSAAELTEAFAPLFKQKMDFTPKDEAALNFAPKPTFESDRTLKVEVNYPTVKGANVKFRLRYVKENAGWKLLGIRLNP